MTNYEDFKALFNYLKLKNNLNNHQSDTTRWEIIEHVHNQALTIIKSIIQVARFVALTCDKMTTLNNWSWILVHGCYVQDSCRVPIMFFVECILEGSNTQNLTKVMMSFLFNVACLT